MDAITQALTLRNSPTAGTPRASTRQLWQAPVFVLGLATLLSVYFLKPYITIGPTRYLENELACARVTLDRPNGDPEATAQALQRLLGRDILPREREGEAHFLYGTALIRMAEHAAAPGLASERWLQAREQLELAEKLGVPEGDQNKLQYRLGKVGFYTQGDLAQVIERLTASVKSADDRAEGYNLLTQAYLRQTPPNLQAALEANEQLRQQPLIGDDVLAPARLLGGELMLRLHRPPEEARKVLGKVGNQAPLAIQTQANIFRARSYQDEMKWAEAATAWQAALNDVNAAPSQAGMVRYNLGLCYRRLEQPLATTFWEECAANKSGDESAAASLELADLQSQDGKNDKALLDRLEAALGAVHKPDAWNNKIIERARACEIFEHCCQTAKQAGKFDLALQLVALYERIASPGRALVLRAEIAADWAEVRQKAARNGAASAQAAEEQAARDLFLHSGEDYEQAAKQTANTPEHSDYLWQAARRMIQAGNQDKARALLEQMFGLTPRPDAHLSEGWFLLGESFRKAMQPNTPEHDVKMRLAEAAYKSCIQYPPTIFTYRARFQIAQFERERGEIDFAVSTLEQILTEVRGLESDPAMKELKEQACFTLVDICYARKDYMRVVQRLEVVLDKLPPTMEASKARYELADSYRLLADEQEQKINDGTTYKDQRTRDHWTEHCKNWRRRAVTEFEALVAIIEKPESASHLDALARRNVYYLAAYIQYQLGNYEQSLDAFERMAQRYANQPDHWTAIAGTISAYTGLKNREKVREGLQKIRDGMNKMDLETQREMQQYLNSVEDSLNNKNP